MPKIKNVSGSNFRTKLYVEDVAGEDILPYEIIGEDVNPITFRGNSIQVPDIWLYNRYNFNSINNKLRELIACYLYINEGINSLGKSKLAEHIIRYYSRPIMNKGKVVSYALTHEEVIGVVDNVHLNFATYWADKVPTKDKYILFSRFTRLKNNQRKDISLKLYYKLLKRGKSKVIAVAVTILIEEDDLLKITHPRISEKTDYTRKVISSNISFKTKKIIRLQNEHRSFRTISKANKFKEFSELYKNVTLNEAMKSLKLSGATAKEFMEIIEGE